MHKILRGMLFSMFAATDLCILFIYLFSSCICYLSLKKKTKKKKKKTKIAQTIWCFYVAAICTMISYLTLVLKPKLNI